MNRAVALVLLILLAGCLRPLDKAPLPDGDAQVPAAVVSVLPTTAYEPSVGITADGSVFVNALQPQTVPRTSIGTAAVWRSRDGGATWEQVLTDEDRAPFSGDPYLWVDPATDRIFTAELPPACAWLSWSDDDGATWDTNAAGGCGLPLHHFQKLTGGPPPAGVATDGYPSVLYYSSTSLRDPDPTNPTDLIVGGTGTDIAVSLDGGLTFGLPVRVHPPTPGGYSQAGPVAVGPDGTAWSPAQTDDGVRIAVSDDAGATWTLAAFLDDAGYQPYGSDPSLTADASGRLHLLYPDRDSRPVLRSSDDGGATWSRPISIAPADVTSTIFPLIRTLGDGRLAAAYFGTTAPAGEWGADPSFAPPTTSWHLYLALIEPQAADPPMVTAVKADEDPVQQGCIWMRGGTGGPEECRNIGDFIGLATAGGLVAVAYVDGCDHCPENQQSSGDGASVALWRPLDRTG